MVSRRLRLLIFSALLLLLLCAVSLLLLNTFLQNASVRRLVLEQISQAIGYNLHAEELSVSFRGGVGISGRKVNIGSSLTDAFGIRAERLVVDLDVGELIRGRFVPGGLWLFRARIELAGRESLNLKDLSRGSPGESQILQALLGLGKVTLKDASFAVRDLPFELQGADLNISPQGAGRTEVRISLQTGLAFQKTTTFFSLSGSVRPAAKGKDREQFDLELKTEDVPLARILWPELIRAEKGQIKAAVRIHGDLDGPVLIAGKVSGKNADILLNSSGRGKNFQFSQLELDFAAMYAKKRLQISRWEFSSPRLSLAGELEVDLGDLRDPRIALRFKSPFMPLAEFKRGFPGPLLPAWLEGRLFPMLKGGSAALDGLSLEGSPAQLANLGRLENSSCLEVRISWKEMRMLQDAWPLPFESVAGHLVYQDGALLLSGIKGRFGESLVRQARLEAPGLLKEKQTFHLSVDGRFALQDLLRQRKLELIPPGIRRELQGFQSASGTLEGNTRIDFTGGWERPKMAGATWEFKESRIRHDALPLPLLVDKADVEMAEPGAPFRFAAQGRLGNSEFETTGALQYQKAEGRAEVNGRADLNEIGKLLLPGESVFVNAAEAADCRLTVGKKQDRWTVEGELDGHGIQVVGRSFSVTPVDAGNRIRFALQYKPQRSFELSELKWLFGESSLEVSGFRTGKTPEGFPLRVFSPRLRLEDVELRLDGKRVDAGGGLRCRGKIQIVSGEFSISEISGNLAGKDLWLRSEAWPVPLNNGRFQVTLEERDILVHSADMRLGKSSVHIQGHLTGWEELKGRLHIEAEDPPWKELLAIGKKKPKGRGKAPGPFLPFKAQVDVSLTVPEGSWRGLPYGPLQAEGILHSNMIEIRHSTVRLQKGYLWAKGNIQRGKDPGISIKGKVYFKRQPVAEILRVLGLKEISLEGPLTMYAVFDAAGRGFKDLLSGVNGSANVLLEKGQIKKAHAVFKILDFMSLQKIFKKKPPDLSKEGLYYETIGARFTIDRGVCSTDNLIMKSPVFNVVGSGRIDLPTKQVALEAGVQPMGTIDVLISHIPVVGYVLTGKEKALLIYYFKVAGPLGKPTVRYVPLKKTGGRVIKLLERLFKTPGRLLDELSEITEPLRHIEPSAPAKDF